MRNKLLRYIAAGAMLVMLAPFAAQAHSDDGLMTFGANFKSDANAEFRHQDSDSEHDVDNDRDERGVLNLNNFFAHPTRVGTVTAVSGSSFTLKANNGIVYTVNTSGSTTFNFPFKGSATFADIHVNDMARVRGTASAQVITAASVVIIPANNRPAVAKGTVTAVSGSSLTLQLNNNANSITVNTDSNTTVTKADGSAGTTADVHVGSAVKVRGLWDMVLNVFKAITIHLK